MPAAFKVAMALRNSFLSGVITAQNAQRSDHGLHAKGKLALSLETISSNSCWHHSMAAAGYFKPQ